MEMYFFSVGVGALLSLIIMYFIIRSAVGTEKIQQQNDRMIRLLILIARKNGATTEELAEDIWADGHLDIDPRRKK